MKLLRDLFSDPYAIAGCLIVGIGLAGAVAVVVILFLGAVALLKAIGA